jgi:hypothetical protein
MSPSIGPATTGASRFSTGMATVLIRSSDSGACAAALGAKVRSCAEAGTAAGARVILVECLLHRVQLAVGQALHGGDLGPVHLERQDGAALHAHAVQQDGARPAVGGVAPDDRAGPAQAGAEIVHEQQPGLDLF